ALFMTGEAWHAVTKPRQSNGEIHENDVQVTLAVSWHPWFHKTSNVLVDDLKFESYTLSITSLQHHRF
ncbi:hypothetical protein HAX54_032585, partial [Datura stramonium]|nr:hypothetical protein [Datura stramonium]